MPKAASVHRQLRFIDLFAGLGGFHLALSALGHECVFASEINEDLQGTYKKNFGIDPQGDIRSIEEADIPAHDVLCAGFPCQPFSKAGEQLGTKCKLWGDLFTEHVLRIIRYHRPSFFIMENVANLERHNGGRTWSDMRKKLEAECKYTVSSRVLSPHAFGIPQIRDRLYIIGSRTGLSHFNWPERMDKPPSIKDILDDRPKNAKQLSDQVLRCLEVWQEFLDAAPPSVELSAFPLWTMEFGATYPFTKYDSLCDVPLKKLRGFKGCFGQHLNYYKRGDVLACVPSYARTEDGTFPDWKQQFIRHNRRFYEENKAWVKPWLPKIRAFPPSLQKLEWHCQGEKRDIWKYVIQFRASGERDFPPVASAIANVSPEETLPVELPPAELAARRVIDIDFDQRRWRVILELTDDPAVGDWLEVSQSAMRNAPPGPDGREMVGLRMSVVHPFVARFAAADEARLEPLLRIAAALGLAEKLAREGGVRGAGVVRSNVNRILKDALSRL